MKVRAVIQARMLSQRLRGKSLMSIHGLPLLYRVIESVRAIPFIDEVVVATTQSNADDPIEAASLALNVKVYRGDALDVLNRFTESVADLKETDCVIRFTADNPLNYWEATQQAYELHRAGNYDYTYVEGLSHIVPEFIQVRALREANKIAKDNFDREHVTPFLRRNKSLFALNMLPKDFFGLRADLEKFLTVDTPDDLNRFEKMYESLESKNKRASIANIYEWLDNNVQSLLKNIDDYNLDFEGILVGKGLPCYVIAEIGQNHNGDINIAKKLIDMSVRCGANAVKFQKRDIPSELTKEAFDKPYDNPNSFGKTYGEHRLFLELSEEQHFDLKEYAASMGITYFCTPCDVPSVELLERIGCPFYKVASRDLTNTPLLKRLGQTGKKVILSTGMADIEDITDALEALNMPKDSVVIMQCTSEYPCALNNVNLRAMKTLEDKFGCLVGLSDHTSGIVISTAAAVLGATMVEKHVTLNRTMKGTDQPGSLEESGLKKLIDYIRAVELAMGDGIKDVNPATKAAKEKLARSLTSKVAIKKGQELTEDMLTLKSPGTGLKWRERNLVIGKKALKDISSDCTIYNTDFE
jgi:sialic acid synthase SpsE/spore coat polysaccharide biosynthesis protein SpsF (cytidylyltransferase family)